MLSRQRRMLKRPVSPTTKADEIKKGNLKAVQIYLPPELVAGIAAKAAEDGLPLRAYLENAIKFAMAKAAS